MNIATWITLSRLLMLPLAILPVVSGWNNGWFIAAAVTALAGLTDVFDGYIARNKGQITALGTNMDLIIDKVFVVAMFIFTYFRRLIPLWIPVIFILREVAVTSVRLIPFRDDLLAPDAWGKTKTAVSFAAIIMILMQQDLISGGVSARADAHMPLTPLLSLTPWVTLAAVMLTVFSGMNYLVRYGSILRHKKLYTAKDTLKG